VSEAKNTVPFAASSPDSEVPAKPQRRLFSAEEKKRMCCNFDRPDRSRPVRVDGVCGSRKLDLWVLCHRPAGFPSSTTSLRGPEASGGHPHRPYISEANVVVSLPGSGIGTARAGETRLRRIANKELYSWDSTRYRCAVQAARRSYRWCSPPTSGIATIRPASGAWTGRDSGVSFCKLRCVRLRW